MKYPVLLLVLDGLGDEAHPELDHLTPLQSAHLPTFNHLAKTGQCGQIDPIRPGIAASTAEGTLAILGYDPQHYKIGRGVMEALGAGLQLQNGDIALRGNFACIDEHQNVKDRRAGRIRQGTLELIDSLNTISLEDSMEGCSTEVLLKEATEHRLALVLRGEQLSDQIVGSDPTDTQPYGKRITPYPINTKDAAAKRTASLLDQFEKKASKILQSHPINHERVKKGLLPANTILTRGPGITKGIPAFHHGEKALKGLCIGAEKTVLGLARMAALDVCTTPKMTANLDTDLTEKFNQAYRSFEQYDVVMVHIKGGDIAAHDMKPKIKKEFLEQVDHALGVFIKKLGGMPFIFGAVADHCTSSLKGHHIEDPVPIIINHPEDSADSVQGYDEIQVASGKLGRFQGYQFLGKLLKNRGRSEALASLPK